MTQTLKTTPKQNMQDDSGTQKLVLCLINVRLHRRANQKRRD
jgi:hypothetical protein